MVRKIIGKSARGLSTLCAVFFLLIAAGCVKKVVPPEMAVSFLPCSGEFLDPAGDRMPLEKLVSEALKADYVLIGEGHTNRCDHKVQLEVTDALTRGNSKAAIGLEMVTAQKQDVLNRFNLGQISVDELPEALDWKNGWRYDFNMFRPIFELASNRRLTVAGLNFPFRLTGEVRDKGLEGLSPQDRALLPEKVISPPQEQEEGLKQVLAMHKGHNATDSLQVERFFLVQSLWDTAMAEKSVSLRRSSGHPVIILAGGGHVEHGWGIARRLKILDPEARIMSILPWRGEEFYPTAADAFFYCPPSYESRMGMTIEMRFGRAVVTEVKRDRKGYRQGLRPGDILVSAQGIPVTSLSSLHMAGARAHNENRPLVFTVDRHGDQIEIDLGLLSGSKKK